MQQQPLSPCLFLGMTNYPPTDIIISKPLQIEERELEETPLNLIHQIESHIEAGEYEKAKDLLCQAFSKNIFDSTPYYLYAKTLFAQGLHKLAIRYLKEIPNPNEMAKELLASCKKRKRETKEEQSKLAAKRAEIAKEEEAASNASSQESDLTTIEEEAKSNASSQESDSISIESERQVSLPEEEEEELASPEKKSLEDRVTPLSSSELCDTLNNTSDALVSIPTLKSVISIPSHQEREAFSKHKFSSYKDSSTFRKEKEEDKRSHSSHSSERRHEKKSRSSSTEKRNEKESRSARKRSSESLSDSSRENHYSRSRSSNSYEDSSSHRRERSGYTPSPSSRGSHKSRHEETSSYHSKEDARLENPILEKGFQKPKPFSEKEVAFKKRKLASHTSIHQTPTSREEEVALLSAIHLPLEKQVAQEIKAPKTSADLFPSLMADAEFLVDSLQDNGFSTEALINFRIGIPKLVSKGVIQNVSYRIVPLKWQKEKVYPTGWQNDKSNFCESLIAGFNLDEFFIQPRKTLMLNVPDEKNPTLPKNPEEVKSFIKRNVREANDKLDLLHHKDMHAYSEPAPYIVARLSPDLLLNQIRFKTQSIDVSNLREAGSHDTSGGVFYYIHRWLWKGLQEKNHILQGYTDLLSDGPLLDALKNMSFVIKIFRTEDVAIARSKGQHYEPITIYPATQPLRTIRLLQTKLNDGSYHFDLLYPES